MLDLSAAPVRPLETVCTLYAASTAGAVQTGEKLTASVTDSTDAEAEATLAAKIMVVLLGLR